MKKLLSAFALSVTVFASACADARGPADCQPRIEQGWIRLLPGGMPMHGGFARIDNRCATPITITGAKSTSYGSVELHETRNVEGVMRMRQLKELRIAPKDAAVLKPSGLHLMLMDTVRPLKPGGRVAVVFMLADGREVVGEFIAKKPD